MRLRNEEGGNAVEEKLKDLMQELGNAINESLSDSDRIAAAIGEIKRAGYDVFLVLEATIGFNKREDSDDEAEVEPEAEPKRRFEANGKRRRAPLAAGVRESRSRGVRSRRSKFPLLRVPKCSGCHV